MVFAMISISVSGYIASSFCQMMLEESSTIDDHKEDTNILHFSCGMGNKAHFVINKVLP